MYPNLYYIFKDWFGVDWNFLKLFNSFGLFVALAFIISATVLSFELKLKQKKGLLGFSERKVIFGAPATLGELVSNFLLGFIFGYKILGALLIKTALDNPQEFLLSTQGHLLAGITVGIVALALKFYEAKKQELAQPEERILRIWPHDRVGDIVVFAALFGFLGAKIFHNLENWSEFIKDPIGNLISFSGLTFYGGLICAGIAIFFYAKKHKINFLHLGDCLAPTMMLAYGLGRIGCQVSGDGDWGIINSAFITDAAGHILHATPNQFTAAMQEHHGFLIQRFGNLQNVHHIAVQPVSWLPQWLFGYNYPHNVISEGTAIAGCNGNYCSALPFAVFPTPFYETIVSILFFGVLLFLRNKIKVAGMLLGIYFMLNGFERFMIEKIRVNTQISFLGFAPTQAEIIATTLFLLGAAICVVVNMKRVKAI
jgi:phosphatidylglycerol---prolipoprotein diacylglyceryl transferase